MRRQGFTVIELLVIIAMILVIAAIAVPRLFRSRIAANEATAISALQSINRAQAAYHAAYPAKGFATKLSDLGGPAPCTPGPSSACLIDKRLAAGAKSGYNFSLAATDHTSDGVVTDYVAGAAPQEYNKSGVRLFCTTSDAVIHYGANTKHASTPPDAAECRSEAALE